MGDLVDYAESVNIAAIQAIVENLPNDGSLLDLAYTRQDSGIYTLGRAITAVLRVWPNGDDSDGSSFSKAYTTIPRALDATSVNDYDCTLILISPHGAGYYDMDMTGDPEWNSNVIIKGTHRNWAKVMNTYASATSILKLTGRSSVYDINFNLGTGKNGLIQTRGGARTRHCQFVGYNLTSPATALWYDTASQKHFKVEDCDFLGNVTYMTGLKVDQLCCSDFDKLRMHECLVGLHIVGDDADENAFKDLDIGDCAKAIKIDAGNQQHFERITLHGNTVNVDDAVGDHIYNRIYGQFPIDIEPDNLVGVQVNAGAAGAWGGDTEIRAALTSTKPFRVVAVHFEPSANEWYQVRFSADSGATWYDDFQFDATKREGIAAPSGTEYIFNVDTRISASVRSVTGGNNVKVWLEIQEI